MMKYNVKHIVFPIVSMIPLSWRMKEKNVAAPTGSVQRFFLSLENILRQSVLQGRETMRFHFFKSADARKSHQRYGMGGMPCDEEMVEEEIRRFLTGQRRAQMCCGARYYLGQQDILERRRTAIGQGGKLTELENLPCAHVVDNRYRLLVDQKTDYLLGKPFSFRCDDPTLSTLLTRILNRGMMHEFKNLCRMAYNEGIAWLYLYYDRFGALKFRTIPGHQLLPVWRDEAHRELEYAVRIFEGEEQRGKRMERVRYCEVYDVWGIHHFRLDDHDRLVPRAPYATSYLCLDEGQTGLREPSNNSSGALLYSDNAAGRNRVGKEQKEATVTHKQTNNDEKLCMDTSLIGFGAVPLIPFRCSGSEQPLICRVKSLQDGLNTVLSNFQDVMQEDVRNTILVLVNYDGEDLGEFRRNLAAYGAVKVKSIDGVSGDLKTLQIAVNHENYESIIAQFREAIIDNGMGFDNRLLAQGRQLNELAIRSMYAAMDLDANEAESEWQASLERLVWFLCRHSALRGNMIQNPSAEFIFDRDMLMDENEIIAACRESLDLLSRETVIANHPWVRDPQQEIQRLERERNSDAKIKVKSETNMMV